MSAYTNKEAKNKLFLKHDISDDKSSLDHLENLLADFGYKNTQYMVFKNENHIRLEIEDKDSIKFDRLVNELWDRKLLASNEEDSLSWF